MFYEIYVVTFFGFFAICDGIYLCFCGVDEMSKYDWSDVPKNVMWIATDSMGCVWGYLSKPVAISHHGGYFDVINRKSFRQHQLKSNNVRWRDSLEERPE